MRVTGTGVTAALRPGTNTNTLSISFTIAADAEPGERDVRILTPGGLSNRSRFMVGELPELNEIEPNSDKAQAQRLEALPVVVNGRIEPGDTDFFRFTARAGQTLVFEVQARALQPYIADAVPGWLDACLTLYDANGKELRYVDDFRFSPDPVLFYPVEKDGDYLIEIRDVIYRGRADLLYRLTLGALPYLTHIFPLGGQRNTAVPVELRGVNLPAETLNLTIPTNSPSLRQIWSSGHGLTSNARPFAVGDLPEVRETEPNDTIAQANRVQPPVVINGRIQSRGDSDFFIFKAEAKQRLIMEVQARRLDSPLDSILTLLNPKGQELAENDDAVDPGEALVTHHADSRLAYTFPSTGDYLLRIRDVQGNGGEEYAYRLAIGPPKPDFALRITPDHVSAGRGDSADITVHALRKDGFSGDISLTVPDLPKGFVASEAVIPANQDEAHLTVTAPPDAQPGVIAPVIVGTAALGTNPVFRQAFPAESLMQAFSYTHHVPTREFALAILESAGFILTTTNPPRQVLELRQAGELQVLVKASRDPRTKGAIALTALKPPSGIAVKVATIAPDKEEAIVTLSAAKQAAVGLRQNIIITGTLRAGKETISRVAPAIPVKIIAAPP